jgi:hypothetical protein
MKDFSEKTLIVISTVVIILMAAACLLLVYLAQIVVAVKYHNPFRKTASH